jgi:hypothetical protein
MTSLHEKIADLEAYMDDAVRFVPDITPEFSGADGVYVYNVPKDEFEAKCREYDTLTDLVNLRTQPLMDLCHGGWMCGWSQHDHDRYEKYVNA